MTLQRALEPVVEKITFEILKLILEHIWGLVNWVKYLQSCVITLIKNINGTCNNFNFFFVSYSYKEIGQFKQIH